MRRRSRRREGRRRSALSSGSSFSIIFRSRARSIAGIDDRSGERGSRRVPADVLARLSDALPTFALTGKRPRMVLDASTSRRSWRAHTTHAPLRCSSSAGFGSISGSRVAARAAEMLEGRASLAERVTLFSALPSSTRASSSRSRAASRPYASRAAIATPSRCAIVPPTPCDASASDRAISTSSTSSAHAAAVRRHRAIDDLVEETARHREARAHAAARTLLFVARRPRVPLRQAGPRHGGASPGGSHRLGARVPHRRRSLKRRLQAPMVRVRGDPRSVRVRARRRRRRRARRAHVRRDARAREDVARSLGAWARTSRRDPRVAGRRLRRRVLRRCPMSGACAVVLSPLHPRAESAFFCDDADVDLVLVTERPRERARGIAASPRRSSSIGAARVERRPPFDARGERSCAHALHERHDRQAEGRRPHARQPRSRSRRSSREAWGLGPSDVLLHALPLHHMHGLGIALLSCLGAGATRRMLPAFDATRIWGEMARSDRLHGGADDVREALRRVRRRGRTGATRGRRSTQACASRRAAAPRSRSRSPSAGARSRARSRSSASA